MHSPGRTLLDFSLLHFVSKAKFSCYSKYLLSSYFCIPVLDVEMDCGSIVAAMPPIVKDNSVLYIYSPTSIFFFCLLDDSHSGT